MKPLLLLFILMISISSHAVDSRQLSDPKQQESYETLTKELRCLVCQNQTIADSNAELASDLRRQVYEMLQQGKSEQDIIRYMTDRYGEFVLYKPPFEGKTSLLWIAPVVFLVMGLMMVFFVIRRKRATAQVQVNALETDIEKQKKIRSLLEKVNSLE